MKLVAFGRYDVQHNDTQYNDRLKIVFQYNDSTIHRLALAHSKTKCNDTQQNNYEHSNTQQTI